MPKNTELLGKFKESLYSVTRSVKPSFHDVEKFSISIHFTDPDNLEQVEIVRIDNSHGYVHIDKLFKEGDPKEELPNLDAFSAYNYLKNNWKDFARRFEVEE